MQLQTYNTVNPYLTLPATLFCFNVDTF